MSSYLALERLSSALVEAPDYFPNRSDRNDIASRASIFQSRTQIPCSRIDSELNGVPFRGEYSSIVASVVWKLFSRFEFAVFGLCCFFGRPTSSAAESLSADRITVSSGR